MSESKAVREVEKCEACDGVGSNRVVIVDEGGKETGGVDWTICVICSGKGVL